MIFLFDRKSEKRGERESELCLVTLQKPTTARVGSGKIQNQETLPGPPSKGARIEVIGSSFFDSQEHEHKAGSNTEIRLDTKHYTCKLMEVQVVA